LICVNARVSARRLLHQSKQFKIAQRLKVVGFRGARAKDSQLAAATLLGMLAFLLLALFPREALPLLWIAPLLIIEPLAYAIGYPSLVRDIERHGSTSVASIMSGTFFTGIWWELWNYYSLPKWTYTVPYVDFRRIFEMPIIGCLGYPFFGLIIFGYTGMMLMLIRRKRLGNILRAVP
jgi:hypothetical protein